MNAKLPIALFATVGCFFSSAFAMGGEAEDAIRGLMKVDELAMLDRLYSELSALKSEGPLKMEEQAKYEVCLAAIKEENLKRKKLFDLIKEGGNLADYPGILEKVRILYNTFNFNEPDAYEMFVYPAVVTSDSAIFMWIRVDLQGKILKKVNRNTAAD